MLLSLSKQHLRGLKGFALGSHTAKTEQARERAVLSAP